MEAGITGKRSSRTRTWSVRGLIVLASILVTVGAVAIWVQRVVLETPTWTDTSSRVLQNPEVQQALSTYLVDQLYDNVDVAGEIRGALPPRAQPLAAPVAAALRDVLARGAARTLASPRAQALWRTANERANRQLILLLDDGGGALTTTNGAVVLDLHPLVQRIAGRGAVAGRVGGLPADAGTIVLLRSSQLKSAQDAAEILKAVALVLVPIVVLLFALAIWLAADRRRALLGCAIGLLAAGLVLVFLRRVLGDALIDRLVADESVRPAAHNIWMIATAQLGLANTSIMFVGLVGLLGAVLAGPGNRARSLRRWLAPALRDPRCYLGLAAVLLLLLAWAPTPAARNWVTVTVLTVLAVIGFEALRRQTAREFPDVGPGMIALPRLRGRTTVEPPASADDQRLDRLGRLATLHAQGVLSDEEFAKEKARVLSDRFTQAAEAARP